MTQALLADPTFAASLDQYLNSTGLTAALLANFLYNGEPEERPAGMPPYDWRDVYNATTQALKLLSNFLGVCNTFICYLLILISSPLMETETLTTSTLEWKIWSNKRGEKKSPVRIHFLLLKEIGSTLSSSRALSLSVVCYLCDSVDITHVAALVGWQQVLVSDL